jgi:hypothetical protein
MPGMPPTAAIAVLSRCCVSSIQLAMISADDATTPPLVPSRGAIGAVGLDLDSIGM